MSEGCGSALFCSAGSPGESWVYIGQRLFLHQTASAQSAQRSQSEQTACKRRLACTVCSPSSRVSARSGRAACLLAMEAPPSSPPPAATSHQSATSGEVVLLWCRRATNRAPLSAPTPAPLHYSSLRCPLACFSSGGKPKPVGFVFLLLLLLAACF